MLSRFKRLYTLYLVNEVLYELDGPTGEAVILLLNIRQFKSHGNFHFGFCRALYG